jgi:hypothetical protein
MTNNIASGELDPFEPIDTGKDWFKFEQTTPTTLEINLGGIAGNNNL